MLVDPFDSSTIYVGAAPGLLKSTDGGLSWNPLEAPSSFAVSQWMADPAQPNTLYAQINDTLYKTTDGGATFSQLAPGFAIRSFAVTSNGASVYLATTAANNVFVTKLDPTGKTILYSTYVGGSASDQTASLAVDSQGSVYVTGATQSTDFPVTAGALKSTGARLRSTAAPGFVFKLNPSGGKLVYSATIDGAIPAAIAVDSEGDAYVTGSSQGGLAVTAGAYWTTAPVCLEVPMILCIPREDAFAFKLNPSGSSLVYATYLKHVTETTVGQVGNAIALDAGGNAYITGASQLVAKLSADGAALLYSTALGAVGRALALDSNNDVYVTGPGAFVTKFDPNGMKLFSKTIGNVDTDSGVAIALDSSGDIVLAGETYSDRFPLFSPTQGMFSPATGFLAKFDNAAANLLFSTYVGDFRNFQMSGLALDSSGRAFVAGSTFTPQNASQVFQDAFVSEYDLSNVPAVRLDNLLNAASLRGGPVSPGEIVTLQGAGFGAASNTQVLFDETPATLLSATSTSLTAIAPVRAGWQNVHASAGSIRPVHSRIPSGSWRRPLRPGIYSADGSGTGQALAFNQDGTLNSLSNPAAVGSTITFYATGVGQTHSTGSGRRSPIAARPPLRLNTCRDFYREPVHLGAAIQRRSSDQDFAADVFTVEAVVPNPHGSQVFRNLVPVQIEIGGVFAGQGGTVGSSAVEIANQMQN